MLKSQNETFIGYFWAPVEYENAIKEKIGNDRGTKIEPYDDHNIMRPTFFKITDFLASFQLITDTYGVPSYQEANPSLIAIVTFPFLFGVMFGDLGHGSILLVFASLMVLFPGMFKDTIIDQLLPFRHLFLLMGLMSSYCGIIYNEFFALPINFFESCYTAEKRERWSPVIDEDGEVSGDYMYPRVNFQCNYPFGFDPIWKLSKSNLSFANNVKMKISVIFGVIHMSIGIIIKGTNAVYFRRWADLFTEVVTGLIILLGLFGWMDVLIFAKWFHKLDIEDRTILNKTELFGQLNQDQDGKPEFKGDYDNEHMPSVINILINSVFGFGKIPENEKDYTPLIGQTQE